MTWHPQGDYLAVQVDKWTKTKKSTHTNFELFSIRWVGGRRRWGSRVAWSSSSVWVGGWVGTRVQQSRCIGVC